MEHKYHAETEKIRIRPLYQTDVELLRRWRNDRQLSTFLREIPYITQEQQQVWYERYKNDEDTLFFCVIDKENKKVVGTVSLYSFKKDTCEVGRIVIGDPSAHGRKIGYGALLLALAIAVKKLHMKEIRLDVHENNIAARKIYERAGFEICGSYPFSKGGIELEMRITAEKFYMDNPEAENTMIWEDKMITNETNSGGGYSYRDIDAGINTIIKPTAVIGGGVVLGHNCIIEDGVVIGANTHIDSNTIIRSGTTIGEKSFIGSNCIIGEYQNDYILAGKKDGYTLKIGSHCLIRSGSIIYSNSVIGGNFQTGHQVTIRERAIIGDNVSIGTFSDIQGLCRVGNYVRLHSNVHIGQHSVIDDFVWIFPYVVLTNDPTPPSEKLVGVHIQSFAVVATRAVLLPGVEIGQDALIGAGAVVTRNVGAYKVVVGNPAKEITDVYKIKNKNTGEPVYPWRYHYSHNMPWEGSSFEEWYQKLSDKNVCFTFCELSKEGSQI